MSSNVNEPYLAGIDSLRTLAGSAEVGWKPISLRFDQIATAAEFLGDFVAAAVGLMSAYSLYRVLGLGKGVVYPIPIVVEACVTFAVLVVIMLDREGVYRKGSGMLRISETERTLRVSAQAFLLLLPITIFSEHLLPRWVLLLGFLLVPTLVITEKQVLFSIIRFFHKRGRGVKRALIYGAGTTGKQVFSALLRSRKLGINPLVFVDDNEAKVGKTIYALGYHHEQCAPVVRGPLTSQLTEEYGVELIVVAIPTLRQETLAGLLAIAKKSGAMLTFVPNQTAYENTWINYMDIDGILLGTVDSHKTMRVYEQVKRIFDLALSLITLVVFSPILAFIALAVRWDSNGPALFKQQRVGKNGRLFHIYKFRTMHIDAPKYHFSPTTPEDQRITRLGRILRKTSLDELPQIFNVIKGDMSLVGPRPEMPFIVEMYGHRERMRLAVLPGITGLWQLSADRAYLIHENLQYDFYYVRNRGLFMDIAILLHTAMFAIKGV
jgi:exopolysaccharide biosynthesis polyprenyl glycosylphosphotransferase